MINVYCDGDNGKVFVERGAGAWPAIQHEAKAILSEIGWGQYDGYRMRYLGIKDDIRVSDEDEYVHGDDDGCADFQDKDYNDPDFKPCCRTVVGHVFEAYLAVW